jgi:anthranilate phosphoribosyltransferase
MSSAIIYLFDASIGALKSHLVGKSKKIMKQVLNKLLEHHSLDRKEAKETLIELAEGKYNNSQMAAFMTIFMMRSIKTEELAGFREAMLELCVSTDLSEYDAMDMCGTGGDGKDTFNISTLATFVVAGAGQNVTKHGNNGVSSICGSSNLLAQFGYEFTNDIDKLKASLDKSGLCFLHAPLFHPAMKNVAPVRAELGLKTFFNMLGPVVNPSRPKKQLTGVYSLELARLYHYLLQSEAIDFAIVHSLDGYDEISLTGDFKLIDRNGEHILSPNDLGLKKHTPESLFAGNTIEASAKIFMSVLENKATQAQTEVTLANAGLALYCAKKLNKVEDGVSLARESLESGKALKSFKNFINSSN